MDLQNNIYQYKKQDCFWLLNGSLENPCALPDSISHGISYCLFFPTELSHLDFL